MKLFFSQSYLFLDIYLSYADLVPILRDTRGKLKLKRGKYLAHPKNLMCIFKIFMSIFRKNKVKTFILETFGLKQEANTSLKKFLTKPRGNFFTSGSYWVGLGVNLFFMSFFFLAETRSKFLVIKVSCMRQKG